MSAPIPNTSVKAAPLCTSRPKNSFPSIATFNLFRKEPPPQPPSPVEPYEVAPGIWSTDATARVFGYLDTNDKRTKPRFQSAEADIQAPSKNAQRKSVPIRGLAGGYKQAHFVDKTQQRNTDTVEDNPEASTQKDEQRTKKPNNWSATKRGRMRTVSRDDQLVERGANPRTGLVSPLVVSDSSEECLGGDYMTVGQVGSAGLSPKRRTCSGKWKQDSLGWSLVESPLLSPIAQSTTDKMSRMASMKQLENRLLVEIPGVDNPDPENMTDEQIKKYQERIARAYRHGGSLAMLDPDTLPSPGQWTPEGPSTSPTKLHKIPRKEIRNCVSHKSSSGDTVIINADNRASCLPTLREDMKQQKVRNIPPSNTPKGSSFESYPDISNTISKKGPFLGQGSRMACSQTASATQSQSYLNTEKAHRCPRNESRSSPSPTLPDPPPIFPTLVQYLPHLQFPHPSHFANLETSSYRRPTQLLPARLRLLGKQGQVAEDVCTTTFTTTSTKGLRREQRSKMQRPEGNSVVPRVSHPFPGRRETLSDGSRQGSTARKKRSYPSATPVDVLHTPGLVKRRSQAFGLTEKADATRDLSDAGYQEKIPVPADYLKQLQCEDRPSNIASPAHMTHGPSPESAKVARGRIQRSQSGDGCTPTCGHLGNKSRTVPGERLQYIANDKEQAALPAKLNIGGDSRAWCARQWAKVEEKDECSDLTTTMYEGTLAHRQSISRKAADAKLWLYTTKAKVEPLSTSGFIQQLLHRVVSHVMRALHHASSAMTTLKTANATTRDRFRATKDLALAAVYLLILLNLFMVLRKGLILVGNLLYWVWHPMQTILVVIRWCIVG